MDINLLPKRDIKPYIALPKSWQAEGKWNQPHPITAYPSMPVVLTEKGALSPIYLDRDKLKPLIFQNAREEAEWLKAHPKEAAQIAEAKETAAPSHDAIEASNKAMRELSEKHKGIVAERNQLEQDKSDMQAQLEAAQAELAALRAQRTNKSAVQVEEETAPARRPRRTAAEIQASRKGK